MIVALPMQKRFERERSINRTKLHTKFELFNLGYKNLSINREHGDHFINHSIHTPNYRLAQENTKIELVKIVLEQLITAIVLIGLGIFFLGGQDWVELSQPVITQFVVVMIFILPSFIKIIVFFNELKKVENAIEQINELSKDLEDAIPTLKNQPINNENNSAPIISLKNVEYFYGENESEFKIGPINTVIYENEIVIIKGGNGSGKTTLFNIIVGLFQPDKGKVKYKGQTLSLDNIQFYRNELCCHFTDSPVFDDISYIPENKFENSDAYIDELELTGKTNLSFFRISDFNLSFGQKSRLNLMRLLLEDKSIYVLDEWAANQDVHFKEKFYLEIIPRLKKEGKTVILISHDDKYYSIADQLITLRNGQIESVKMS
jgi:putative ATP-binding cassette transporter